MFVMTQELISNMSVTEFKDFFSNKSTYKDLADAYAITHNKFCWVEDNVYDYEKDTPEYKTACAITDEWETLMKEYKNKIFEILTSKGIVIPMTGHQEVLKPFMARFKYIDANGWWIKQETVE